MVLSARPRPATPDAPSPRFLTDEGVPRKPYTMRRHEYIYTISADDVDASKGRLDDILDERRALEARLSSLQAKKEELRAQSKARGILPLPSTSADVAGASRNRMPTSSSWVGVGH